MSGKPVETRNFAVSGKERELLTSVANKTGLPVVFEKGRGNTHTAKELEFPV